MYEKNLIDDGISTGIKGFHYLNYAIEVYEPFIRSMALYENIGKKFDTSASNVERCMRIAIKKANIKMTAREFISSRSILYAKGKKRK